MTGREDGFFIAVGGIDTKDADGHEKPAEFGTIHLSRDGEHWETVFKGGPVKERFDHAHNNFLRCLAYGKGMFVAAGNPGLLYSRDGRSWQVVEATLGTMTVEFGDGRFLAPNAADVQISADGMTWRKSSPRIDSPVWGPGGAGHLRKTVYGNGMFLSIGDQRISISRDGESWTHHEVLPEEMRPGDFDLAFGAGRFVWMSQKLTLLSSINGIQWNLIELPGGVSVRDCSGLWTGSRFLVHTGKGGTFSSPDGIRWTKESVSAGRIGTVGKGVYLRTHWPKGIGLSKDGGKTWQTVAPDLSIRKVYYFDGETLIGTNGG
jgi:hypothetical protein